MPAPDFPVPPPLELVSTLGSGPTTGISASLSGDGQLVAYTSHGAVLRNRSTGTTVALPPGTPAGTQVSTYSPVVSADGSTIAFVSLAETAPGSGLAIPRLAVYDVRTGTTRLAFPSSQGFVDGAPTVSADGSRIAVAVRVASTDPTRILLWERSTGAARVVFESPHGRSDRPSLSPDGRYLAFRTSATLPGDDDSSELDVALRDLQTGATRLVSTGFAAGAPATGETPSVSDSGHFVAFSTTSAKGSVGRPQVFVRDTVLATTTAQSAGAGGAVSTSGFSASR
ncbi:WD40 repeat protein [Motilibacter peucedani]|uniref:WD40 repeat protein n=1 Tax=Motilibacter peucedani TaxID=598650 RepID=A0A420XND3_9ACTN|nr:PD40 domain-containing protein [Motilibacter peucedani]RKS72808.1 WD40 repeat protein [Motilibacter peucedani]